MPQFSLEEKHKIKTQLMSVAKEHFASKGIKKTSLEELTSSVGIAKSSFYVFFESKEILYLELLDQEGPSLEERVWQAVQQQNNMQDKIKTYLQEMTQAIDENPLMKRLQTHPEELQIVTRKATPEFVQKKMERNVLPLLRFIEEQQASGEIINEVAAPVILSFLRAAMTISRHKEDIGPQLYPLVQEMMFSAVSHYITTRKSQEE